MATECYSQLGFGFQPKLVVDFAGGHAHHGRGRACWSENSTSNWASPPTSCGRVTTRAIARYVTHEVATLLRQRLYQIAAGYEDVNDATDCGTIPRSRSWRAMGAQPLGSQPTLSRLENAIEWPAIHRLARVGVDWFCAYAYGPDEHPADLVLDLDSTDDPSARHAAAGALSWAGTTSTCITRSSGSKAAPGCCCARACGPGAIGVPRVVVEDLDQLLPPLRRRFPHTPILLRGDAGMATPAVEAKLEAEGIRYVLGIGTNRVFKRRVAGRVAQAQARYERTRSARVPSHELSASGAVVAAPPTHSGQDRRHRAGTQPPLHGHEPPRPAADLVAWYDDRGASENWIKELKLDIHADRLSCHRFRANAFRLQLHSVALSAARLLSARGPRGTPLATATIGTIRLQLLKVAGRVCRSVRRLWFHLASHWPGQPLFTALSSRAGPRARVTAPNATYFPQRTRSAAGGVSAHVHPRHVPDVPTVTIACRSQSPTGRRHRSTTIFPAMAR